MRGEHQRIEKIAVQNLLELIKNGYALSVIILFGRTKRENYLILCKKKYQNILDLSRKGAQSWTMPFLCRTVSVCRSKTGIYSYA